jgi:hypothetical protein
VDNSKNELPHISHSPNNNCFFGEEMKKYWQSEYEDLVEIIRLVWRMKFKPEGWITHRNEKLMLVLILHDYSIETQNQDRSRSFIHPLYNSDKESIIYQYSQFTKLCCLRTIRTLKKYLKLLEKDNLVFIEFTKNFFEVKLKFETIINAPKFEEENQND